MKTNKLNEYKKMTIENLEKELKELKQELFKLRFSHAMNVLDNPNKMDETKKNIARVNTIITMKKAGKEIKIKESIKAKKAAEKKTVSKEEKVQKEDVKKNKTVKDQATEKKKVQKDGGKTSEKK